MSRTADILVRPYHASDAEAIVGLARELQAHEARLFDRMRPADEIGLPYIEHLLDECARRRGTLVVLFCDGRAAGYATILTAVENSEDAFEEVSYRYAYIGDLAVAADVRGRGLGRRLLDECESIAREAGARWLRVSVLAANDGAHRLYRDFGFSDHLIEMEKPLG